MFIGEANNGLADNADTVTEMNAALQDNSLFNYVSAASTAGNGSNVVTANAKSASETASELSITKNDGIAFAQAHAAAISDANADSDLEDAFNNGLNSTIQTFVKLTNRSRKFEAHQTKPKTSIARPKEISAAGKTKQPSAKKRPRASIEPPGPPPGALLSKGYRPKPSSIPSRK